MNDEYDSYTKHLHTIARIYDIGHAYGHAYLRRRRSRWQRFRDWLRAAIR